MQRGGPCPLSDEVTRYYAARAPGYDASAGYTDARGDALRGSIRARFQEALRGHDVLEIACGTGYWTEAIAVTARSVVATDVDPGMISRARQRLAAMARVRCQVADAYCLDEVTGPFTAAFSHWWWSHVPKSRLRAFLAGLHARLLPGALVLFADQLPYEAAHRRIDAEGNLLERRSLPDGRHCNVVKNFPTEREIVVALSGRGQPVVYRAWPGEGLWTVSYRTARPT